MQQHIRDAVDNYYTFVQSLNSDSKLHSELVTKTSSESIILNIKEIAYQLNLLKKQKILNDFKSLNDMQMTRKKKLNELNDECLAMFKECLEELELVSDELEMANI